MIDFILLLLIGSSWCWGVFTLFHEGYALDWFGNYFRKEDDNSPPNMLGTWYSKPLFDCPPCQASVHGFIISGIYYGWYDHPLNCLAYMICLCGVNFVIKSIIFPEYE